MNLQPPAAGDSGHTHGPSCDHDHCDHDHSGDGLGLAQLEENVIEVAHALYDRYGDKGPTPEQEKEFMREWLIGKGRTPEEADAIVSS